MLLQVYRRTEEKEIIFCENLKETYIWTFSFNKDFTTYVLHILQLKQKEC